MTFYATLGHGHKHRLNGVEIDADCLIEVEAESYEVAYELCQQVFNRRWCSLYEQADLVLYPRGVVASLSADKTYMIRNDIEEVR